MEARLTGVDRRETLRILRYRGGAIPESVLADLERGEEELLRTARPRAVWRLLARETNGRLRDTGFIPAGQDIREHLRECDQVILMAATLGVEVESLLRHTQARDMGYAVVLDAVASAAIENVCDNLCADLAAELAPRTLTDRFSPGYGDFPLSQQRELFAVLNVERRIGVNLSDSGLMIPQKSVTALIGVSDLPQKRRSSGCANCNLYDSCAFRKDGKSCGQ